MGKNMGKSAKLAKLGENLNTQQLSTEEKKTGRKKQE